MRLGATHKRRSKTGEDWLGDVFEAAGLAERVRTLARQTILLLDGSFAVVLLHRDPSYMETAGDAAHVLIRNGDPHQ